MFSYFSVPNQYSTITGHTYNMISNGAGGFELLPPQHQNIEHLSENYEFDVFYLIQSVTFHNHRILLKPIPYWSGSKKRIKAKLLVQS